MSDGSTRTGGGNGNGNGGGEASDDDDDDGFRDTKPSSSSQLPDATATRTTAILDEPGRAAPVAAAALTTTTTTTDEQGASAFAASSSSSSSSSAPRPSSEWWWWGGMYAAILPAAPDVSVDQLWDACQQLAAAAASDADDALEVMWRFRRTCTLVHPQLSRPLPYLEVSGLVATHESCQRVVDALMAEHPAVVGNAELLLALRGTDIPLLPLEMPTDGSLDSLDRCGVVAISGAVPVDVPTTDIDDDILDEMLDHSLALFDALRQRLAARGGGGQQHRYREIMQRDPNRYDVRLDLSLPPHVPPGASDDNPELLLSCWERLERSGTWMHLVWVALGNDAIRVKCGCVISLPGAGDQYWHSDGVHVGPALRLPSQDENELEKDEGAKESEVAQVHPPHALCVFVPLVSLTEETGATEFWAGSHRYDQLLTQKGEASLPGGTFGYMERGGAVVYDYRVVHRGTSNHSQMARPIAYYLYVRPGYEHVEDQNFTSRSIWDDEEDMQ